MVMGNVFECLAGRYRRNGLLDFLAIRLYGIMVGVKGIDIFPGIFRVR
jgi:hypothetical protein